MKKIKRKRKGRILDDHQRVGSRIRSSFLLQANFQETSYVDQILPEIVHIAMILQEFGYYDGIRLCEKLFTALGRHRDESSLPFVSNLAVGAEQAAEVLADLEGQGALTALQKANTPLCLLPSWPLRFLGAIDMERDEALATLTSCVDSILDKSHSPPCAAMATVMYWQGVCGKLHYSANVAPPDLNVMISDPSSAAAGKARAQVRAFMMAFGAMDGEHGTPKKDWGSTFWRECFRLSGCSYEEDDSGD
ncbi:MULTISPECIES: hypothetical protein [unclassified Sphingomonas]|uniref:hypothetical protein n=1 Tax=unclassified Sphingomonas TaxID=196159 RepID=UPI0008361E56|nr:MULTISPECIES: hypothetical protein [unclassified Sphingomonas]